MNRYLCILLVGISLSQAGCTMAPKYSRPAAPVPAGWPSGEAYKDAPAATDAPEAQNLGWKEFFADGKLQQVIGTALTNNRDLRLAALNVELARALYGIQRAELLPAVNAVGGGLRKRVPADLSSSGTRSITEQYSADLGIASWEIDFFGRLRSLKDRALEEYLATEQVQRSTQILLVASVANAYLTLAADRENLALAESTLATQQGSYDLIKRRHALGLVTDLDLYRAQAQVDTARGNLARYQQLAAQDENALNLLLGTPARSELLPRELSGVIPPKEISSGLSSEVLLRRPDVLQAESLLRSANANIGVARATFFPRISLTAALGTASKDLSNLFNRGQGTWNFTPQIAMPIFDARIWSAHKAAKVQREMVVAQYEKTIQSAFKEVADTLAARGTVGQQLSAQQSLVTALAETYRLSTSRYNKGIDSYLSVLDAQRSLYAAQQGLVSLRLAKLANDVRLYAVLGGGWQTQHEQSSIPTP
ncbi:MAG: efflux transporter outer membrane subunit [Opitutaceae bacterium]|nr:efflux transporter outer membrane subunit [Opitutaceae bacterium]